jgi:signal transduction histidine kinase
VIGPRLPLQSAQPVIWFARVRLLLAALALVSTLVFHVPDKWATVIVLAAVAVPWSAALIRVAERRPELAMSAGAAVGDLLVLGAIQAAEPAAYAGVRFVALFLIATHAYFLGELRGLAIALTGVAVLVLAAASVDVPIAGGTLAFYEALFAASAICCGVFVARLRTAESAARLRARELSRRTIEAEARVRRRLAESIHDGPVQELIGLDLMLAPTRRWRAATRSA